ncbi:hypothetical protein ACJJTC_016218 [Scirpophaga incertulas]
MSCTNAQVMTLLDFLSDHKDLARGMMRSADGRLRAKRLWEEITNILNSMGGSIKSVQQWQKLWTDKKYLAKKNAATLKRNAAGTGGGPPAPILASWELKILEIMGDGFGEAQTTARVPAFPRTNFNEEVASYSIEPCCIVSTHSSTQIQLPSQSATSSDTLSLSLVQSPSLLQTDENIQFQTQLSSPSQTIQIQDQQQLPINQTSNIEAHSSAQQPPNNELPRTLNNTTRSRLVPTRRERTLRQQERNIGGRLLELEEEKLLELRNIKIQLLNLTSAIKELTNEIRRK